MFFSVMYFQDAGSLGRIIRFLPNLYFIDELKWKFKIIGLKSSNAHVCIKTAAIVISVSKVCVNGRSTGNGSDVSCLKLENTYGPITPLSSNVTSLLSCQNKI